MSRAQILRKILDQVLSDDVRPLLRERGFTKTRRVFRRQRGPMYDELTIYGSTDNKDSDFSTFSVAIGIGSTEIDELSGVNRPAKGYGHMLSRTWCQLVPGLPECMYFDETYDVDIWSPLLCDRIERVVDAIDQFDSSQSLARWAAANNLLHDYDKTCGYLAAIGDLDTLVSYVRTLQATFGHEERWESFSRKIAAVVGPASALLDEQGVLGPPINHSLLSPCQRMLRPWRSTK